MKRFLLLFIVLGFCFTLFACGKKDEEKKGYDYDAIPDTMEATSYELAFVTDIGQLKDKSFNQGTWEGLKRFAKENNKSYKYYQPANGNNATDDDRYAAMKQAADNGAKVIVCAGFMQAGALERAAKEYKDVKFVFIDGWAIGLENVTAIVYKEEQAGYLAGYAAVMEGYTKLGFSGGGGGTNPACQRFGYGFIQGANDAAKAKGVTKVDMKYSWNYGASFSASPELQTMLEGWFTTGTEVVFSCGGSMVNSVIAAANETQNGKVIGVDTDQSGLSDRVITSAVKGLSSSVMLVLQEYYAGEWDAKLADKTSNLGAAEDSTGLPTADGSWRFSTFTKEQYNTVFQSIKNGTITPSDATPEDCSADGAWLAAALVLTHVTVLHESGK